MTIIESNNKKDLRIHILKNYIKRLQSLLDDNSIDYSELRKMYLFQLSYMDGEPLTDIQKKNLKCIKRISSQNTL